MSVQYVEQFTKDTSNFNTFASVLHDGMRVLNDYSMNYTGNLIGLIKAQIPYFRLEAPISVQYVEQFTEDTCTQAKIPFLVRKFYISGRFDPYNENVYLTKDKGANPCYVIYRICISYETEEIEEWDSPAKKNHSKTIRGNNKIICIRWIPNNAKVRDRMTYATHSFIFEDKIISGLIEIQANDESDLDASKVLEKIGGSSNEKLSIKE
ncbi:hypothetical protein C2G38_2230615 [Gigaspora rosea]|uniref:ADF-H domain-containing protein n=1 Tax=Gigaspora rosea TaxID=44941 RepID=A0A397TUL4_9GLOM|nr:hypothetical protein C2G38_2230615 [Gigaspora rosea]